MSTRRLIAFKQEGGYDYVHLTYEGNTAPDILDANWSTESAARDLIAGGDIAVLAANDAERHNIPGRSVGHASDLEALLCAMLGNENLISIYDESGKLPEEISAWNDEAEYGWTMNVDNPDAMGGWIHLADMEEMQNRADLEEEIAEIAARKAA